MYTNEYVNKVLTENNALHSDLAEKDAEIARLKEGYDSILKLLPLVEGNAKGDIEWICKKGKGE